jgi:group I intron endonuclease
MILGNGTKCGIYKITNTLDNKSYIGQSVDVYKRWCDHCKCGCGIDTPKNNKLYAAMEQDGIENFTFELLEECPREELNKKEAFYIDLYESNDYGYNATKGND